MRICCVCTGNTGRSPLLERLLRQALTQAGISEVSVESAGVAAYTGSPAEAGSQQVLAEHGLDLSDHRSRSISLVDLPAIDRFLCMTLEHALVLRHLGVPDDRITVIHAAGGGVPDPCGGSRRRYQEVADLLIRAAHEVIEDLRRRR